MMTMYLRKYKSKSLLIHGERESVEIITRCIRDQMTEILKEVRAKYNIKSEGR